MRHESRAPRDHMTRLLIAGALALALAGARPATAGAQERDSVTARDQRDQAASMRPPISAATAKAKATEKPT